MADNDYAYIAVSEGTRDIGVDDVGFDDDGACGTSYVPVYLLLNLV